MKYRSDIDGLRAIAVVPVVFFHAGLLGMSGGFIGVDVFFVISGYLITSIILRELAKGSFTIVHFYERRMRRILPAYFGVLIFSFAAAALYLLPKDYAEFCKSIFASTFFVSNIFFERTSDYFAAPAELQPFLHTWSLAVEEQFYIFFPLLLKFATNRNFRSLRIVFIIGVLSFIACLFFTGIKPSAAFYLLPFRAWELIIGALLALNAFPLIRSRKVREGLAALGLGFIVFSVFTFTDGVSFPGWRALLPCLGAAFIIWTGTDVKNEATFVGRALSFSPIVFVGLVSYSFYLWHWPILAFFRYGNPIHLTNSQGWLAVAASLLLAIFSWWVIERPFRQNQIFKTRKQIFLVSSFAMMLVSIISVAGIASGGWRTRVNTEGLAIADAANNFSPRRKSCHASDSKYLSPEEACSYGDLKVLPDVAIWGDSHAVELAFELGEQARSHKRSILHFSFSSCPPATDFSYLSNTRCSEYVAKTLEVLKKSTSIKTVYLVAKYEAYFSPQFKLSFESGFREVIQELRSMGRRIIIIYPIPKASFQVPAALAREHMRGKVPSEISISKSDFDKESSKVRQFLDSLDLGLQGQRIYPERVLCNDESCRVSNQDVVYYFDDNHLSLNGAHLLLPLFEAVEAH